MPARRAPGLDDEIDALFRLPLGDFTAARNALAARLKKEGRKTEAEQVKGLAKPTAPAWAVNQLYGENPKAFDRLFAAAERVRQAQTGAAKHADLAALLDEKKRLTAELLSRANVILEGAGHAASPDAMRRVSATLESLAVSGNAEDAPRAGRLTVDLDPPGFEALAAFMAGGGDASKVLLFRPAPPSAKPARAAAEDPAAKARARKAVQDAETALRDARKTAERAEAAVARANARAAAIEKERQELEARYAGAKAEAEAAATEAKNASRAVADAEQLLGKARRALEQDASTR